MTVSAAAINAIGNTTQRSWIDQDRGWLSCWQIRMTDAGAQRVSNEIAIVFSLVIPSMFIIVRRFVLFATPHVYRAFRSISAFLACGRVPAVSNRNATSIEMNASGLTSESSEVTVVETLQSTGDEDNPIQAMRKLLTGLRNARETEDRISDELDQVFRKDIPSAFKRLWSNRQLGVAVLLTTILVIGLCILGIIGSLTLADIVMDSTALSSSPYAGDWVTFRTWALKDVEAAKFKDECYSVDGKGGGCDRLYQNSIAYTRTSNTSCPFEGDMCLGGSEAAFTLSTGLVDSSVLGINAHVSNRFAFERQMTCAAVPNDGRYVQSVARESRGAMRDWWHYYYGHKGDKDRTMSNAGDWSRAEQGNELAYNVGVSIFNPQNPKQQDWRPVPELRAGNSTVSLIAVAPSKIIWHRWYRDDPIFPANNAMAVGNLSDTANVIANISNGDYVLAYSNTTEQELYHPPWDPNSRIWVQASTRAGILGCVDSFQICNLARTLCWDQGNFTTALSNNTSSATPYQQLTSAEQRNAFYLIILALKYSNAYYSLDTIGGGGLEIQKRLEAGWLWDSKWPAEQWKVEAEALFQTSLARMQLDVFNYARGSYMNSTQSFHSEMDFAQKLDDEFEGVQDAHRLVKFRAAGYKNVSGLAVIGSNAFCAMLFLASRRYSTPRQREEHIKRGGDGGYHDNLWVTIVLKVCWSNVRRCNHKVGLVCKGIWRKGSNWIAKVPSRSRDHGI